MKNLILVAALISIALPAKATTPTKWTLARQVSWVDDEGGKHHAIGLFGEFSSRAACLEKNGGKIQTEMRLTDGREVRQRCSMLLEIPN
jgi:hypothetical protein